MRWVPLAREVGRWGAGLTGPGAGEVGWARRELTGITTTAVVSCWVAGISPSSARFAGERSCLLRIGLGVLATVTVALVTLQLVTAPALVQGSRERDAEDAGTDEWQALFE